MTRIVLADSDTNVANAVNLMNLDSGNECFVTLDGFKAPPPKLRSYSSRPHGASGGQENVRTVTLELWIQGGSMAALDLQRRRIWNLITLAERTNDAAGGYWVGSPVCLWVSWLDSSEFVFFDVLTGDLTEKKRDNIGPIQQWTLSLTCAPYTRGRPVLYGPFTLANGLGCSAFIPNVPGDTDALCQIVAADGSIGGAVLNGMQWGRRSLRGMQAGDFAPAVAATAISPGVAHANTAAMNGATEARLASGVITTDWQAVATIPVSGSGLNHGLFDLVAHVRDSTTLLDAPYNLTAIAAGGGGSVIADTYTFVVSEVDASGNETVGSDPVTVLWPGPGTASFVLNWQMVGTPADHKVYVRASRYTTWDVYTTGSSGGSYALTVNPTGAGAHPPTQSGPLLLGGAFRARVALGVPSPQWSPPGPVFYPQLGNSRYEWAYLGTWPLPPLIQQEGQANVGCLVLIEGKAQSTGTPNLDCSGALFFPHDEPQLIVETADLALAAARTWQIDTRRDLRVSGLLTDGINPQGQVNPRGAFTLGPGGNVVFAACRKQNGEADLPNVSATVTLRAVPRYLDLSAVAW